MQEVRQLFEKAIGLVSPWKVSRSEFDPKAKGDVPGVLEKLMA